MTITEFPTQPTTAVLASLIGYYRSDAEVEAAGFTFDAGIPSVGEVVALHSRGGYRQAIVTSVTRTGTVKAQYVTQGGLDEAQRGVDYWKAMNAEASVAKMAEQDRQNHAYYVSKADGTCDLYRRFPNQYGPERKAAEMAEAQAILDEVEAQGGIEAVIEAKRAGRLAEIAKSKSLTVLDRVGISTGTAKAAKVARVVVNP